MIRKKAMKMKKKSFSEDLLLEEVTEYAGLVKNISRGLPISAFVKMIRTHLGMSQAILAKRANVPQSTISRIEKGDKQANLATLSKILEALSCDLVLVPMLRQPIDQIRRQQARRQVEHYIYYLKGTMGLEDQQPDPRFIEKLKKQEEERLLQGPGAKLWGG